MYFQVVRGLFLHFNGIYMKYHNANAKLVNGLVLAWKDLPQVYF